MLPRIKEQLRLPPGRAGALWLHRDTARVMHMHRHDELEFNLAIAGSARYLLEDRRLDLAPGTLVWLFPAQNHLLVDRSADFAMWIGVFRPNLLRRCATEEPYRALRRQNFPGRIVKQLTMDRTRELHEQCQLVAEQLADGPRFDAGLAWVLLSAWRWFLDADTAARERDVHPAVERAARLIRAGQDPDSIDELGAACGLSGTRLSRLFKQQIGLPLARFRQQCKLERFFSLYALGRKRNVTQAALEAGFGSYAQFHRVFRQRMGYGPQTYRRRLLDDAQLNESEA